MVVAITYLAELHPPRNRGAAIGCMQIFWVVGTIVFQAMFLSWRFLVGLSVAPPILLVLVIVTLLPESPRYLLTRGKVRLTLKALQTIFAMNTGMQRDKYQLPNLARSQNTYAGYPVSRLLTLGTPIQSRTPGIGLVAVKLGSFPKHVLRKSGELAVASKYAHSVTYTGYRVKVMKDNDKLEEMRYYVEETLIPAYMKPRCYCIPILLMSQFFLMFGKSDFHDVACLYLSSESDPFTDQGPALAVLQNISEPTRLDYDALTSALVLRFGDKHLRHLYHAQLKNRVQRPNESLAELAADVERLSQLALEGCPADTRDVITVGAFLDAISDREVQQTVRVAGLRTMREALARALEVESPKLLQGPRGVWYGTHVWKKEMWVPV
uniref:Uncharacterized protein n=1 Tax=Timema poppense TaxID=170557 RepID=A0A7R9DE69_TIMPO|nr:unnamed protein product [Timema poppensis]